MTNTYSAAWAEYRRRRNLAIISALAFVAFPLVAWRVTSPGYWSDLVIALIEMGILLSVVISGTRAALWPCPRCGKMFRGMISRNCRNCGLPLWSHGDA